MKSVTILNDWKLCQADRQFLTTHENNSNLYGFEIENMPGTWYDARDGWQVHEVLLNEGILDQDILIGKTESCKWVAESDWIYQCRFQYQKLTHESKTFLLFRGIDTIADIYLNGQLIGHHDDMYIPQRIAVSSWLREENILVVHFHSPWQEIKRLKGIIPELWKGRVQDSALLRKSSLDFMDFGNCEMVKIGLFDQVLLEQEDRAALGYIDIETNFSQWYDWAEINTEINLDGQTEGGSLEVIVSGPNGETVSTKFKELSASDKMVTVTSLVQKPELWWPKGYGEHPLYRVNVLLRHGQDILDSTERYIGLRKVEHIGNLLFRINGKQIRLWGGNLVPFSTITHRWKYNLQKCVNNMLLIDNANMNIIRLWGGGMQFGDELYDLADQYGILIWQDFILNWGYYPDGPLYRDRYRLEAEHFIKRLKHHPSILLWCGGNESYMHNEEIPFDKKDIGFEPVDVNFRTACKKLDPSRLYWISCPSGGEYPCDTREGDSHPLNYTYRHPVEDYCVFTSESARSSTGPLWSLKKFMTDEELWPEGYVNQITYNMINPHGNQYDSSQIVQNETIASWKRLPLPPSWYPHCADFFISEMSPVERFYDAHDIDSLIYRINASYAYWMQDFSEKSRRGKPFYDLTGPRRVNGYLIWKINDSFPQFYASLTDSFCEPYIPYYSVKRCFEPVLLSFDCQDHIMLWAVNDTPDEIQGILTVRAFSQIRNCVTGEFEIPVSVLPGESKVLTDLDRLGAIARERILYASLTDSNGKQIAKRHLLLDLERHLIFPEAKLTLSIQDGELVIQTDQYAHCIELSGNELGDQFGWYFEDNYFDLLPFETKRVKILGRHKKGVITAKAHYSPFASEVTL